MDTNPRVKKALFGKLENGELSCGLCPHNCRLPEGSLGICGTRRNSGGQLFSLIYGCVSSLGVDPIEKKPLYHFYPGSRILSAGTVGCNFRCSFCQNWEISQNTYFPCRFVEPRALVSSAEEQKSIGIAYTYSEPLIWYEYVSDCAKLCKSKRLKNVLVTNGYINREPLEQILPYIDAMNVDLKSFNDGFYRKLCKGTLEPVLNTIRTASKSCHIEITNLLIPGENDSESEIDAMSRWIEENTGRQTPLHISKYFPRYRLNAPETGAEAIKTARDIALKHLDFVYAGNVDMPGASDTLCPECGAVLIERSGYNTEIMNLKENICGKCGSEINIISS
ncbi:MAG: AmmeMemoRadiSam system radical SAM enzyme [Candidatus Aureabacteria bacterium]|nr:AmmeMemoRadiSam system radical SAM enzyme [Candidatus Auribacterota bacterium]